MDEGLLCVAYHVQKINSKCAMLCFYNVGRSWNSELRSLMEALQDFLEEECELYFDNIKEHAVKVTACHMMHISMGAVLS